jgi:hypothetical protein
MRQVIVSNSGSLDGDYEGRRIYNDLPKVVRRFDGSSNVLLRCAVPR